MAVPPSEVRFDPLAVKRITPFVRRRVDPENMPPDHLSLLSLAIGVAGLMIKWKWASWVSLFFCMSSLSNVKAYEADLKQIGCSIIFTLLGLFMNYFGSAKAPRTSP